MNKNITTIIVDDTPAAITALQTDLHSFPEINVLACYTSAKIAVDSIIRHQPELLFLDIEMPEMSGLELLEKVKNEVPHMRVVFYTAYNRYLIDAVRASAFDYLQKPYLMEELQFIVNRLLANGQKRTELQQSLRQFIKINDRFAIHTLTGLMFVRFDDVLLFMYIKDQRYWLMKLTNGESYKLRTNVIAKGLTSLSDSFIQINQQCIVNINYVLTVENKTLKCILCPPFSDIDQTVSTRFYKTIKDSFEIY